MPSRTNRLRNRRAISGEESSDDADISSVDSPATTTKRSRRQQKPSRGSSTGGSPLRLRRLLLVLLVTTLLLGAYHLYRLSRKGQGLLVSPSQLASKAKDAAVGAANASPPPSVREILRDSSAPGGMIVRPGSDHDSQGDASADGEVKLEDLDMDTLQAAFDALYGDGGPLAPKRGRGGEDGQYSHVFRKKGE